MKRFKYCGDVNIEYGGYFYSAAEWRRGYADVVRVTPCSDAGAQNNCYWIDELTVIIPDTPDKLRQTLRCIGMDLDKDGYRPLKRAGELQENGIWTKR